MRDTRGYAARRLGENLWVPAGLARGRAAVIVAVISTLALIAVLYVDVPVTGAVTPVASASESTASHPTASGLCLTAAATVPTGAGASSGCTGASAAGADLPHRAGSAESPTEAGQGSRRNSPKLIGPLNDLVYRSTQSHRSVSSLPIVIDRYGNRRWPAIHVLESVTDRCEATGAARGPDAATRDGVPSPGPHDRNAAGKLARLGGKETPAAGRS